jgi:hypothetical protein
VDLHHATHHWIIVQVIQLLVILAVAHGQGAEYTTAGFEREKVPAETQTPNIRGVRHPAKAAE